MTRVSDETKRKRGTLRPDRASPPRDRRNSTADLGPPDFVRDRVAVEEWNRIVASLRVAPAQRTLLALYCNAVAAAVRAEEALAADGRYYVTTTAGGSEMRRRHPAAQDAAEAWQAARAFARQLGITGGGIEPEAPDARRAIFK